MLQGHIWETQTQLRKMPTKSLWGQGDEFKVFKGSTLYAKLVVNIVAEVLTWPLIYNKNSMPDWPCSVCALAGLALQYSAPTSLDQRDKKTWKGVSRESHTMTEEAGEWAHSEFLSHLFAGRWDLAALTPQEDWNSHPRPRKASHNRYWCRIWQAERHPRGYDQDLWQCNPRSYAIATLGAG